jgi:hypothetical protein
MHIQYVGFNVASSSRVYDFDVIDTAEVRKFTVKVQSDAFRPARLKLQDGPGICFALLKQELEGETPEARVGADLSIGEQDIQEYLGRNTRASGSERKQHRSLTVQPNE